MQDMSDKKSKILDNIRKRIIYFADTQGGGRLLFMKATGIKIGMFDPKDIDRAVGSDKISNILEYYRNLSAEWLLMGIGPMLKESLVSRPQKEENKPPESNAELVAAIIKLSGEKALLEERVRVLEAEKKIKKPATYSIAAESPVKYDTDSEVK